MNLALPSSIARMAVSVRFFQRQGVAPAVAVTSGAIDSFTGNVVQAVLLVLLLIFSSATLNLDVSAPDSSGITELLIVLIGIAVVVVLAVVLSRPGRRAIAAARERVRRWWPQVRGTLSALRGSHKLAQLILGNLATEILFATALGMFTRGLGLPALAGRSARRQSERVAVRDVHPVPGGIGVVEGGMLVGLTAAGVPESAAFASIILYRITTFYLPPVWGWFALNWLRRKSRSFSAAWVRQSARCCRWQSPSRSTPYRSSVVVLLLGSARALANGPAFAAGWFAGILILGAIVLVIADAADASDNGRPSTWVSVLKLALGAALVVLAVRSGEAAPALTTRPRCRRGWARSMRSPLPRRRERAWRSAPSTRRTCCSSSPPQRPKRRPRPRGRSRRSSGRFTRPSIGRRDRSRRCSTSRSASRAPAVLDPLKVWLIRNKAAVLSVLCLVIGAVLIGAAIDGFSS